MSYLLNDPTSFADEMVDGFVLANHELVRRVEGGVARATATAEGQVAVVIGGGSGHYPAFAGLVGQGLAHGAALGNVFASPSAQQAYSVAKAVATEAGVLFTYGNYAGDVLNFDQAQERLIAEGIPCRTVVVTDDISSASDAERGKRRGVAGDLVVFRAAAWAAEQGHTLDQVHDLAQETNERTRTLGVAFSGCTLPGADAPLFSVPEGRMAVGMGIHGEPGIDEADLPTADELGHLLVSRVLEAAGHHAETRVAVILNGLGSVKTEELFVTYRTVAAALESAGLTIVAPEVGEMVTSFEMAGVSLTVTWLTDDIEASWTSPAAAPAYRRGSVHTTGDAARLPDETRASDRGYPTASEESRRVARRAAAALHAVRATVEEHVEELGRLDAVAGDGDHGIGMQRGVRAAVDAIDATLGYGAGAQSALEAAGDAWADKAGGTSGALWGVALRTVAARLGNEARPDADVIASGVQDAADALGRFGKAERGDKTMLDSLYPFAEALRTNADAGRSLPESWSAAADVCTAAAASTADLVPKIGRARPHAEKSLGTPDPGAFSLALAVTAIAGTLTSTKAETS